jgi:hypothetical protein
MDKDMFMVQFYPEYGNGLPSKIPPSEIPILVPRECLKPEKDFEGGRFLKPLRGGRTAAHKKPPSSSFQTPKVEFKEDSLYPVY